ncbi:c-type cytochrome [Pseudomonas duriflava]|nr:cytochrome c [Pseudomonas duriflava]
MAVWANNGFATDAQRGEYLTRAGNCQSCHTRKDGLPFAGGVPFKTPFGTLYSSNITPDNLTGIGAWSDEQFLRAMHEGIRPDGQHLYPAFPYTAYTKLSRNDVLAIRAYLRSRPAVTYRPPANDLRFPYDQRWLIQGWKLVNFREGRFNRISSDEQVNWGAYLSEALGHCGECHTPRTWNQGLDKSRHLAGATQQGWTAWNITPDVRGIGAWSDEKLLDYLRNGHRRGEAVAGGPMAQVVSDSLRYLKEEDLQAIIAYLRSLPAQPGAVPARSEISGAASRAEDAPVERLFNALCESCHHPSGNGMGGAYLYSFPNYSAVRDPKGTNLIRVMLEGLQRRGANDEAFMPAYRDVLSDAQIADLATYIGRRFGGHTTTFTPSDVAAQREE